MSEEPGGSRGGEGAEGDWGAEDETDAGDAQACPDDWVSGAAGAHSASVDSFRRNRAWACSKGLLMRTGFALDDRKKPVNMTEGEGGPQFPAWPML